MLWAKINQWLRAKCFRGGSGLKYFSKLWENFQTDKSTCVRNTHADTDGRTCMRVLRTVEAQRQKQSQRVASHRGALKAPPVKTHTPLKAESVLTLSFTCAAKITWVYLHISALHLMGREGSEVTQRHTAMKSGMRQGAGSSLAKLFSICSSSNLPTWLRQEGRGSLVPS